MNQLTKFLVDGILNEGEQKILAAYGGGFKPPTSGHFEVVKQALKDNPEIDEFIIYVGSGTRNGITQAEAILIWEIYQTYLPMKVKIEPSKAPIGDVLRLGKNNPQDKVYFVIGAREGNEGDLEDIKNRTRAIGGKHPNMEVKVITTKNEGMSGTNARKAAKVSFEDFAKFLPTELSNDEKETVYNIVKPVIKESLNESFYLDIPKFNQPQTIQQYLIESINEISLSKENAVDINGDLTGGTFTVGDITYEYNIKNIPNPYKDLGLFYNIQFTPKGEVTSIPKGGKENYIKILSTMYKIIVDFIEKEQPDYIGISSLDSSGGKNYHTVYNRLTDNNLNLISGYFRKDSNLTFDSPQGKGRFIVLKRKKSLNENASYSQDIDIKHRIMQLTQHMLDKGMNIEPLPSVEFVDGDNVNAREFFGKTAYYDPNSATIVLYTEGRHPKDIVRSFSHEMIHHIQNLEGRLDNITTTNTQEDDALNDIEAEANLKGTMTFRNWTDSLNESLTKNSNYLYHWTSYLACKKIIESNKLKSNESSQFFEYDESRDLPDYKNVVFFTVEDERFADEGNSNQCILVVDKSKLSKDYKVISYGDPYEETVVYTNDSSISILPYLKGVLLMNTLQKSSVKKMVEFLESKGIPYEINDNLERKVKAKKAKLPSLKKELINKLKLKYPNGFIGYLNSPLMSKSTPEYFKDNSTYSYPNITINKPGEYGEKNKFQIKFKIKPQNLEKYINWFMYSPDSIEDLINMDNYEGEELELKGDIPIDINSLNENILPQEKFAQEKNQDYVEQALKILPNKDKYNLKNYTVKILSIDKIKPTQFGEDYINASSEYEAEQYQKYIDGEIEAEDLRREDFYPIVVDKDTMEILDGNHRHAVHTMLSIPKIKAILVSKKLNEAKKPYKHKHGFDDKLGKDPFGISAYARELALGLEEEIEEGRKKKKDPKKGTGKKPKDSSRRLYTDEDPKDTVGIKFRTKEDIVDTLNKKSFKAKSHARQSQIINLIHQRVRAAYGKAKDPDTKSRLKRGLDYITKRKESSKKKTQRLKNLKNENVAPNHDGKAAPYGSGYDVIDEDIKCSNCGWEWKLSNGGDDPYLCHKCGHDNKPNLMEGRYDTITNKLSKIIFEAFKDMHDRGEDKGKISLTIGPDDEDIISNEFEFDLEATVEFVDEDQYEVDGGANVGFDDEGDEVTPLLSVRFKIPKNPKWNIISFDIKDVVRHELEHLTQEGGNLKSDKFMKDDQILRNLIDMKLLSKAEYFKLEKEVDAMLQGMYFKAKKSKTPFEKVLNDYLDIFVDQKSISKEEKDDVLNIWRSRRKSLSLPPFE